MPIYEYECGHCSFRFDIRQGFDDDPLAMCPECQGRARRVFQPTPIIFKGSGFYITDSRGASRESAVGSNTSESKSDTSGSKEVSSSKSKEAN